MLQGVSSAAACSSCVSGHHPSDFAKIAIATQQILLNDRKTSISALSTLLLLRWPLGRNGDLQNAQILLGNIAAQQPLKKQLVL